MRRISTSLSRTLIREIQTHRSSNLRRNVILRCYCNNPSTHDSTSSKNQGPLIKYKRLVEQGKLQHDPFQEKVAIELENLLGRLEQYEKDMKEYHYKLNKWEKSREDERRRLLTEEAEARQHDGVWTAANKQRSSFMEKYIIRKRNDSVEPGVGKWVSYLNRERRLDSAVGPRPVAPQAPKGLYLYGNVGSGKTMLMDMFYSSTEGIIPHRRRYHFHEAMLEINEHMHNLWKKQVEEKSSQSSISSWIMNLPFDTKVKEWLAAEERYKQEVQLKNILPAVADKFLVDRQAGQEGASILCFDEIQTVDVFAIIALSGILSRLLTTGTVLVATSNRAPEDLNQDGMQKDLFLKLVRKLDEHCQNVLIGSEIDYRRFIAKGSVDQVRYFSPLDDQAAKEFEKMWSKVTNQSGGKIVSNTIPVMFGRYLEVPESCNGVARFTFDYLCGRPVGAADYIAVAKNYHTIFVSDIPMMSMRIRDKARRFITLVDELYNHHCSLFCTAASSIDNLFQGTDEGTLFDLESFQFETETEGGALRRDVLAKGSVSSSGAPSGIQSLLSGQEEMFAFRRAVSRLIEMQSSLYLERVSHIHPYFQKNQQLVMSDESDDHSRTSQPKPSSSEPAVSL